VIRRILMGGLVVIGHLTLKQTQKFTIIYVGFKLLHLDSSLFICM
jgi:hypothetical protein